MGRLHVDEMLDAMTPEEFDEWYAADSLDPLDDSWRQAGEICATTLNAMILANSTETLTEKDFHVATEFIPWPDCLPKPKREEVGQPLTKTRSASRYGPTKK